MMRLGGLFLDENGYPAGPEKASELAPFCEKLDRYGLSAIGAPARIAEMDVEECREFGEQAKSLDVAVGEAIMAENLLTPDVELRDKRIELARTTLQKADAMGCKCVVILVGTQDPSDMGLSPWPGMDSDEARATYRDILLRILDGLELRSVRLATEPWCNTFYYQPEAIRDFIDSVGDERYGFHLDLMNMVTRDTYYKSTELVQRVFDCLDEFIVPSVHLKDIRWDDQFMFFKLDEVVIGDGVIDYDAYLTRIASRLPDETLCFCEHFLSEDLFARSFEQLHSIADRLDLGFRRRQPA
ncbi:MAG TPA: TIM barrel protein [Solirubrobacterales bacterium]|nr:TIM barrel protein [Solirubrobacterales bacterium]